MIKMTTILILDLFQKEHSIHLGLVFVSHFLLILCKHSCFWLKKATVDFFLSRNKVQDANMYS